jgi:hypothetical protein
MKINKTLLFSIAVFAGGPVWAALSDDIRTGFRERGQMVQPGSGSCDRFQCGGQSTDAGRGP